MLENEFENITSHRDLIIKKLQDLVKYEKNLFFAPDKMINYYIKLDKLKYYFYDDETLKTT